MFGKYCNNDYTRFNSFHEAKITCLYDDQCRGVRDNYCDDDPTFALCSVGYELTPSVQSRYDCVYDKTGISFNH